MKKINFTKTVAAGNDFVVLSDRRPATGGRGFKKLVRRICERRTGVGADGILVLEKSCKADFRMRIFNADGSEAEMCGNGLRCAVFCYAKGRVSKMAKTVETQAGIYEAVINASNRVKIKMEEPKALRQDMTLSVSNRNIKAGYIDTGVPHAVIFVEGLEKINVDAIGRELRYHEKFKPRGANADFVEIVDAKNIKLRTYERGVEAETLACGTGAVAAAIVSHKVQGIRDKVNVQTKGGVLKVSFKVKGDSITDVYLEGEAKEVYKGEITI